MLETILVGVFASIIASIIWWTLTQLYAFDTRKNINYKLMLMRNDNYDYQKYLEYKDYDLALSQVQRMLDQLGELYSYIKPLTYTLKKKKLIYTIINSLHYQISYFQRFYKGYGINAEKEACCDEAKRLLYIVGYEPSDDGKHPDPNQFESVSQIAIELLSDLNSTKSVKTVLRTSYCFNGDKTIKQRKKLYLDLIDIKAFKFSLSKGIYNKYHIASNVFTKDEYKNIITKL